MSQTRLEPEARVPVSPGANFRASFCASIDYKRLIWQLLACVRPLFFKPPYAAHVTGDFSRRRTSDIGYRRASPNHPEMAHEFNSIVLTTEAQMLFLDMWDGCMVSKSACGAPGTVVPRQMMTPRTQGTVSDRAINELLENDLANLSGRTSSLPCKLSEKGQAYARYTGGKR
jgi:hypothetical protein